MKLTKNCVSVIALAALCVCFILLSCKSPNNSGDNGNPALTGTVSISGVGQVGQTLTADTFALNGSGSLSYRWLRGNDPISGATGSFYTLAEADRTKYIKVEVKRSGYKGTVTSDPVGPIVGIGETPVNILYAREYWGEWIRMDTGETYYFSSDYLLINGQRSSLPGTIAKESEQVIVGNSNGYKYWLYASRPATARFTGRVVDNRQAPDRAARAFSFGGMNVIIGNIKNEADKHTIPLDSDGEFEVAESIAGDEYQVIFPDAPEIPPVKVTPGYNGDDIGTVTMTEGVNFKVSIKAVNPNTDKTRLYADFTPYDMEIRIVNTGTEIYTAANWTLEFNDDLYISPRITEEMLGSIRPGETKSRTFSISCYPFLKNQPYDDKKINITINDPVNKRTWKDSVQLQFHKAPVNFNIKSENAVQGVIISPEQKAYHFKSDAASNYSSTVTLPWTTEPYLVVFSGATYDTESKYSLGINVTPDTNFQNYVYKAEYGLNNTQDAAYIMDARTQPKLMSYLYGDTIQYFSVKLDPDVLPVYVALDTTGGAYTITGDNNGDGVANPGESFNLNIKAGNIGTRDTYGVTATLSTVNNSGYLSISNSSVSLGTLTAGGTPVNAAYGINVSSSCPAGVDIPMQVEFANNNGDRWRSTFDLHVYPPGPANVKAEALSETSVRVTWNQAAGATEYKIYDLDGFTVATISGNSNTQYEHTGLNAGTVYSYRIGALAGTEESVKSPVVSARTWERLLFNKQYSGTVSAGIQHYYRFYVTNGVNYTFTSSVSVSVKYETGDTDWFALDEGTVNQTAVRSGWAYIILENVEAYTLKIRCLEAGVGAFSINGHAGTIGEADKTITVNVPFGTSLTSLTPSVTPASGWTCMTTGAKNFTNPVEYVFTKGDVTQIYSVTVMPNGQGGVTINPPPVTDITIGGFPTSPFTISKSGTGGYLASRTVTLTGTGYSNIEWWIGEANKTASAANGGMTFVVQAASCTLGEHTLTVIVYKDGIPYSNEINFTVVQ